MYLNLEQNRQEESITPEVKGCIFFVIKTMDFYATTISLECSFSSYLTWVSHLQWHFTWSFWPMPYLGLELRRWDAFTRSMLHDVAMGWRGAGCLISVGKNWSCSMVKLTQHFFLSRCFFTGKWLGEISSGNGGCVLGQGNCLHKVLGLRY